MQFPLYVVLLFAITTAQRSLYGQECNKILRCERRAWLTCINGTCACVKEDEMIFNEETGKCASKAGERCRYYIEHSDGSKSFEMMDCIPNANCDSEGYCVCNNGYFEETNNGTCTPQRVFGDTCDDRRTCKMTLGLQCVNGTCGCDETVTKFIPSLQQCIGFGGEKCVNARCDDNSSCKDGVCDCNEGYFHNRKQRSCTKKYGINHPCEMDRECQDKPGEGLSLQCVNAVCQCDPSTAVYATVHRHERITQEIHHAFMIQDYEDYEISTEFRGMSTEQYTQCVGRVDSPCIDGLCAPGAYCQYRGRYSTGYSGNCACRKGRTESAERSFCGTAYMSSCHVSIPCISNLACQETSNGRKCLCPNEEQEYSKEESRCLSVVGGPCNSNLSCVQNSQCQALPNAPELGLCTCKQGYIVNVEDKCDLEYGTDCDSWNRCDTIARLKCVKGKCVCPNFGVFVPERRICLGLVGASCDEVEELQAGEASAFCVENSVCQKRHPKLLKGKCGCRSGYSVTHNYTCALPATTMPVLDFLSNYKDVGEASSEENN